tara:strand:- start:242433 stop:246335 length:3903 start_codon:yes stop_codon:yes gene_type:complete
MKRSVLIFLLVVLGFGTHIFAQCDISEDFDAYNNGEVPTDWTLINVTDGTSNVYGEVTSNPSSPTPPKYFRMYSGNATTGDLTLISPLNATTSDGNHRLKFYSQGTTTSSLIVGTMDTDDGTGVFTTLATITLAGTASDDWEYNELVIPAGTDQFIAFRHNLADTFDQVNIDSICLETIPTCLEVANVALANPTQTTLDLSWTESASGEDDWEYVVQEVGTGEPTTNGIAHTSTDANPMVTIIDLDSDTEYEAYVRANCGGGDFGAWIYTGNTVRTDCDIITENYCEDWAGIPDNSVPFCWTVYDDPGTSGHAYVDYEGSYSKNMFELYFTSSTVVGDIVAISPDVSYAMDGNHRLKFTAGGSTNSPDVLEVGTIDNMGNFVFITSFTPTSDRNVEYLVALPDNDHSNYAFRHSGIINKFIWINTVCIEDIPSCLEVTDITATNIQYNSADINWNASGSAESAWEYIVQESTLPEPDASTSGTETMTQTVTVPLAQNTTYKAYVRAKCDATDFGAWIASSEFTSACDGFVAEYQDGFEGANVSGEEVKPCWNVIDNTNGDLKAFSSTFGIDPSEGSLMVRMFFPTSADPEGLFLVSPEFFDFEADKQLRFKMNKRTGNESEFDVIVGTVADPSDMTTFTVLDDTSLNETNIIADTWTEFTIDFTSYDTSLDHHYVVFKPQHSGTGSSMYVFMDEFNYEYVDPQGLNDEVVTAHILTASDDFMCNNAITGDFVGATQSVEFPCTGPTYSNYNDIWYRFTPTESGIYAFGLDAVNGDDMNMFVFEGSSVDLMAISSGCSTRFTAETLEAGVTYFVSIASPTPNAEFSLCVYKYPETPVNDEIANAQVLLESDDRTCNNILSGYTGSATFSTDSACSSATVDVWYTFTPSETGEYTFRRRFVNGSAVTGVSVYSGTPGNLTSLTACGGQRVLADLVQGEQYYVAVSTSPLSQPVYFTLCAYKSPPPPDNDICETPLTLTVGSTFEENEIVGTNISATVNLVGLPLPTCGTLEFEEYGRDVWFEVVVPESGAFVVETRFEDDSLLTDTVIETYTGSCGLTTLMPFEYELPSGAMTHCSDQFIIGGGNQFAGMRFTDKQPGETVLVRVWGWARQFGDFRISAYDDTASCLYPNDVEITDVTDTSAVISWSEVIPAPIGGYEYIVQLADTGYPGAAMGTSTIETSVLVENLTQDTDYEVYVKSICDTNESAWDGPFPFTTDVTLGVTDIDLENFKFYPNPVSDVLNVSYTENINTVTVYSLSGKLLFTETLNTTNGTITMSGLASGLYILEAQTDASNLVFKVFVK